MIYYSRFSNMFWSLIIKYCDLFVIWCLYFGILTIVEKGINQYDSDWNIETQNG